jgi:CelD/BcsL family acetyltransferase involved in cellulose biosynthesis
MRVESLRHELTEAYDRFLSGKNCSLFYHSSKYKDFLKDLLGCEEEYLIASEGGTILGALPLMCMKSGTAQIYNSLPYYGSHGGVITDDQAAHHELVRAYNEIASCAKTISSTLVTNPFTHQATTGIRFNYTDHRIGQFTGISCPDNHQERIMERIDPSARRNIKKAIREGVGVEINHAEMDRLREMHQANMRAIGGTPKSDKFFELVPRHFTPGQDFDLFVAKKDDLVIAGLLVFYFNQTVEYFTPAIDGQYRDIQPLSLVLITAMTEASRRGFLRWNWGGTWAGQTGVYRFKRKWGAAEQDYYYYTQLNDKSILEWTPGKALETFHGFFVVPFSALNVEVGVKAESF